MSQPDPVPVGVSPTGPRGRRFWSVVVLLAFLSPAVAVVVLFLDQRLNFAVAERTAEAQAASAAPKPATWGVLGAVRLEQGRISEALPLLARAAAVEQASGAEARDTLTYAKANLEGIRRGVPGASFQVAERSLLWAESAAPRMPKGKQAATWFSAGLFWQQMGRPDRSIEDLRKAVALQADDWVDEGGGVRYKSAGLSEYYQTMLAGALER